MSVNKSFHAKHRPLTDDQTDLCDKLILVAIDVGWPWRDIAKVMGVSLDYVETLVVESLEGEP